jgi:cell division cycle protein 37
MPLNYSKWDALELSDDSDIEGHPNVDHKSLVRMKQRQIHEQRAVRKQRVAQCEAEVACNQVILPRLKDIHAKLLAPTHDKTPITYYNHLCDQLRTNPSPDKPPTTSPDQPTYDQMVLSLLLQISEKVKGVEGDEEKAKKLAEELDGHMKDLVERTKELEKEIETEKQEQSKKITSEDVKDGFETHYQPPVPAPAPLPNARAPKKSTAKTTEFEVLNPTAVEKGKAAETSDDEEEEGIPELTPNLLEFSRLPLFAYEKSFEFIQKHRDVVVAGASDALLVAGFRAQRDGKSKYAKQCVHQSLLLQYGEKLGVDGFGMFFRKMITGDVRAKTVFEQDVEKTYALLVERVRISEQETAAESGRETIQLVPQSEDQVITFNVPDGPPPENLVLEGPGTEELDVEEVRNMLQFRWEAFEAFPHDFQEALKTNKLEEVNKVLGELEVDDAEKIVEALQAAGIMSFAGDGIVDQTGK